MVYKNVEKKMMLIGLLAGIILISGCVQEEVQPEEEVVPSDGWEEVQPKAEVVPSEDEEESIQPIPESALKSQFGYMAHHGDWQKLQESRERYSLLNLSWERAHPGFANWQEIEPKKGEYNWEKIDRYVKTAQERDIQILFTVWSSTDWDQETCNSHLKWQPNDWGKDPNDFIPLSHRKGKPCDMDAYAEFLRRLVERYDGDSQEDMPGLQYPIKYWEIGNEPDGAYDPKLGGAFFQGSSEDYFEILKVSYTTIKEADPNAKVLIASLPSLGMKRVLVSLLPNWVRPDFVPENVFELGAADYFDIMNVHSFGRAAELKDLLKSYGVSDRPIWVTEPGGLGEMRADMGEELTITLIDLFEEEFKNGVTMIFLGAGKEIDPALHKAIDHIKDTQQISTGKQ